MNTQIKATANQSARTFTLREQDKNGKTINKYRTLPMSQEEFEIGENNTSNDWKQFFKSDGYYFVKVYYNNF